MKKEQGPNTNSVGQAKDPCTVPTEERWCCVLVREIRYALTAIVSYPLLHIVLNTSPPVYQFRSWTPLQQARPRYPGPGYDCVKAIF